MAALNITHDMLRKNLLINETRQASALQLRSLEEKIDAALVGARQLEL